VSLGACHAGGCDHGRVTDVRASAPPVPSEQPEASAGSEAAAGTRWLLATGALAALVAAASVLLCLAAITVLLWASAQRGENADGGVLPALRAAGLAWLLAHRVASTTPAGELTLAPLLITAVVGFTAARAAGWAARSARAGDIRSVMLTTGAFAAAYGLLAGTVAAAAGGATFRPSVVQAVVIGVGFAGGAGTLAGAWSAGELRRLVAFLPSGTGPAVTAAAAGVMTMFGGGALLAGASLGWHADRASELFAAVGGGGAGALGVLVVCVAYLPNAALWAAAFAAGPGFAVGYGTEVALGGVQLGAVPALPLFAVLPGTGAAPLPSWAALGVPLVSGVVTGLIAERRTRRMSLRVAVPGALGAAAAAGAAFGLLAWLSGGGAGGRLSLLGPPPWLAAFAVAAELAVVAPLTLVAMRWRRRG
jgi:Family of unknown function (DUF6350)